MEGSTGFGLRMASFQGGAALDKTQQPASSTGGGIKARHLAYSCLLLGP